MISGNNQSKGQPGIAEAALFGLCPQCQDRTLFVGIAIIAPKCASCGLDYVTLSANDGRGWFLVLLIAVALIIIAIGIDVAFTLPFWAYAVIFIPVTFAAVFYGLRLAKTSLVWGEFAKIREEAQ